jgi:hypothetical protein
VPGPVNSDCKRDVELVGKVQHGLGRIRVHIYGEHPKTTWREFLVQVFKVGKLLPAWPAPGSPQI